MNGTLWIFAIMLIAAFPSSLWADSLDSRAKDGVDLFLTGCVATNGSKDQFLDKFEELSKKIGDDSKLFKALPADAVQKLQAGRPNGIGFAMNSPRGAQLIIDYEDSGVCGVRVKEADEASVQKYFEDFVQVLARRLNGTIEPQSRSVTPLNEYRKTFKAWLIKPLNGRSMLLALTTMDYPAAFQQHFMTFNNQ